MEVKSIREQLHQYVEKGDEKLLRLMYALAKEYNDEDDFGYEFTEEDIKLFDERRAKRSSWQSKTYSWQEAKEIITGKKAIEGVTILGFYKKILNGMKGKKKD